MESGEMRFYGHIYFYIKAHLFNTLRLPISSCPTLSVLPALLAWGQTLLYNHGSQGLTSPHKKNANQYHVSIAQRLVPCMLLIITVFVSLHDLASGTTILH
jgi:hypothetical protein